MIMYKTLLRTAAVLLATMCMLSHSMAQVQDYVLMITLRSEIGTQTQMPLPVRWGTLASCNRMKKNNNIKTVWPRGTLISPGGKSYAWTVVDIKCQRSALF